MDTRKAIALLAYVGVVDRPVARESLAELLWPESDPDGGRGALRRTISVLRSGLGGRWLLVDRRQVALAGEDIELDVAAFREAIRAASHRHPESEACPACRRHLTAAGALFRGDFLEGFALRDSAPFDEWQSLEREALRNELGRALRRLVGLEAAEGRWTEATDVGRRLVLLDPLDERAHRALMEVHAAAGDSGAAARQYQECVRVLDAELGVGPSPETTALSEALVQARPRPAATRARAAAPGLDPVALDLLAAAAVLGHDVDPDLAREVSGFDEGEATRAIETLVGAGHLLEPRRDETDEHYHFADEDLRIGVVEELGLARRRGLHRRAAAVLEMRFDRTAPDPLAAARIADHLAAGGLRREAAAFQRISGEAARRLSDHTRAAESFRAALRLGDPDEAGLQAAIGDALTLSGRYGEALAAYEIGAALARPDAIAGFEHSLGALHLRRGALELADLHLTAAFTRLSDSPSALRARVLADRCLVAVRRGEAATAHELADASLAEALAAGDAQAEAQAESLLAMLARRAGDNDAARAHLRRSLDRAGLADDPTARVAALNSLALLERSAGNLDAALALTDEALRRCVIIGDRHREAALRNNRADLLHALGRPADASDELVRSVTAFAEVGDQQGLEPEIWKLVEW